MGIARLNDGVGKSVTAFIGDEIHDGQHRGDLDTVVKNKRMMTMSSPTTKKGAQTNSHSAYKQRQRRWRIYWRL